MSRARTSTVRGLALSAAAPAAPGAARRSGDPLELAGIALQRVPQSTLTVDREARTIDGVTIITAGECFPINGAPFLADDASLAGVVAAINDAPLPVRVHITHPSLGSGQGEEQRLVGVDGILRLAGIISAARIEQGRARGRVTLGRYADASPLGRMGEYLLGVAEEHPTLIGLSIRIGQGWIERSPGEELGRLRLVSLMSVDFVGEPGGNPAGLLAGAPGAFPAARIATTGAPPAPEGSTMTVTAAQLEYLESLGLKVGATPAEIDAFIATLAADQKTHLLGLGAVATVSAPASGSAASNGAPGAALARGQAAATSALAGAMLATAAAPPARAAAPAGAAPADGLTLARAIRQVATLSGLGDQWAMDRIEEGATVEQATQLALASRAAQGPIPPGGAANGRVSVGHDQNLSTLREAIEDGILLKAGLSLARAHPRANEFRGRRIVDMARVVLASVGVRDAEQWPASRVAKACMNHRRWAEALAGVGLAAGAYSPYLSSFSNVLSGTASKAMQRRYAQLQPLWPHFCTRGIAPDFKTMERPAIGSVPPLVLTTPGDLITFATRSDRKEVWALGSYTGGWVYTFQQLVNDELDAFGKDPQDAAFKARQKEDSLAFAVLSGNPNMADGVALFHATHANLAGAGAVLSEATISAARAAMRKQTDLGSSEPLDLVPGVWIGPAEYESLAIRLFASPTTHGNTNGDKNPVEGLCKVVASGRLSTTAYFFAVAPGTSGETIEIGFLEGYEQPEIASSEDFDSNVIKHSVEHHISAKALDWRGLYKNPGA